MFANESLEFVRPLAVLLVSLTLGAAPATVLAQRNLNRAHLDRAIQRVLETARSNTAVPWNDDESGSRGTVTVERTFYLDRDTPCRAYNWTRLAADGARVRGRGTGCRSADGSWELDEEEPVVVARARAEPAAGPPRAPECSCPSPEAEEVVVSEPFTTFTLPKRAEF